jgi:NTE family protein
MLQALLDRDIVPDVVVGCSAGALNGAVIATDPTPATVEHLADVWLSIRSGDVFPGSKLVRAWNILRRDDHLFPDDGLRAIVERARAAPTFEELEVPLRVVATDLDGGEEVVFASGPIEPALLASAAIPGLFPPVEHDGRLLVDRVYVCNVTGSLAERRLRSPLDVAVRAFAISRNQRFDLELRHAPPDVDVVLLPTPVDQRDLFDFSDSMMLIEEAHHLVGRALDEHEAQQARAPERARRRWFRRRHDVA